MNARKSLTKQFIKRAPETLLLFSIILAFFEFILLFIAAKNEDVLFIDGGIGLLNNYGVFASLVGDALLLYLIKKYYEEIRCFFIDLKLSSRSFIDKELESLSNIIKLKTRHKHVLFLFAFIGIAANVSNSMFHILGLSETHWHAPVFDSIDHVSCFILNRINALFSWAIILPFCLYVTIFTTIYLIRMIDYLVKNSAVEYDLLNPDRCGGFSFVGKANIYYNFAAAIVYLQITLHIITFNAVNIEHILSYSFITLWFLFGNSFFFNQVFSKIKVLRLKALNKCKDEIYNHDYLSFEIYKYYQSSFASRPYTKEAMYIINFIKAVAVALPFAIKIAKQVIT